MENKFRNIILKDLRAKMPPNEVLVCEDCHLTLEDYQKDEEIDLVFTTAEFPHCPLCNTFKEMAGETAIVWYKEISRDEEPCDCGDHIRHNNGGNYHLTYIRARFKGYYPY